MPEIPGFAPDEIVTAEPTRSARLKWVIVVDSTLAAGRMANAVACVAATTGRAVAGMVGPGGRDADGIEHPGLPWAGCSLLAADPDQLVAVRARAVANEEVYVVDMPLSAQTNRVYDDYLGELATTAADGLSLSALSIVGPRNAVDRMVKRLSLLA